jgi:hypothetical protein
VISPPGFEQQAEPEYFWGKTSENFCEFKNSPPMIDLKAVLPWF